MIHRQFNNGKVPHHVSDTVIHIDELFYKHAMDALQKIMVLVEAHDKLGHQGVMRTYHLIKQQYYWKEMNKAMHKCIANCTLCRRGRENTNLSLTNDRYTRAPHGQDCHRFYHRFKHIHTRKSAHPYYYQLSYRVLEAFLIPDRKADTKVHVFINNNLPFHMGPRYILPDNGKDSKN